MAEHLGDSSILHLRVDGMSELLHARVEVGQALLQAGTSVGLVPRQDQVMRFDSSDRRLS
jgi:multiple sugar transport system ATP-binding protein